MGLPARVTICSYRLGGTDGVSIEAEKWRRALVDLGCSVATVAGEGEADEIIPGLAAYAQVKPNRDRVEHALRDADVVIVENLCSLPLNPLAGEVVADVLRGRPTIFRHHDLASQRPALAHHGPPPDWPGAIHVTINEASAKELAAAGIAARTIYNSFDPDPRPGRRDLTRAALGVEDSQSLLLQPTRAIPRKNVQGALALAEVLQACYWLLGEAEDGYDEELKAILAKAQVPVLRGPPGGLAAFEIADAYAACDIVALPSTWEGFGNPAIEAATHDKPLAVGPYLVARELVERFGFCWFGADDPASISAFLESPDEALLRRNHDLARRSFSVTSLPATLALLLAGASTI